ncbi:hypothetical protein Ciccas_011327 [Cichlidogyrus casuarinus]|uniref:Uncharacterized protein n=1 Tax=Cichlidogyrus casuarinus TaxID=1844966 RepID=A0ABD2PRK0_9PLAT
MLMASSEVKLFDAGKSKKDVRRVTELFSGKKIRKPIQVPVLPAPNPATKNQAESPQSSSDVEEPKVELVSKTAPLSNTPANTTEKKKEKEKEKEKGKEKDKEKEKKKTPEPTKPLPLPRTVYPVQYDKYYCPFVSDMLGNRFYFMQEQAWLDSGCDLCPVCTSDSGVNYIDIATDAIDAPPGFKWEPRSNYLRRRLRTTFFWL